MSGSLPKLATKSGLFAALAALSCVGLSSNVARATIVERVVAVVGERAILLSDLKQRATPFLMKVLGQEMPDAKSNAAISQVFRATLDRMVEEELEHKAAAQAHITVTSEEIDQALRVIASQIG